MNRRLTSIIILLLIAIMIVSIVTQANYLRNAHRMRNEQFSTLVHSAMYEVAKAVERDEVRRYLIDGIRLSDMGITPPKQTGKADTLVRYVGSDLWEALNGDYAGWPEWVKSPAETRERKQVPSTAIHQQDYHLFNAYFFHREILDEIVFEALVDMSKRPIRQRVDVDFLTHCIKDKLTKMDITDPFIYRIYDRKQHLVYTHGDFSQYDEGKLFSVRQPLFEEHKGSEDSLVSYVQVYFPNHDRYMNPTQYVMGTFVTIGVLFILCIIIIIMLYKQQHFIRNRRDFVNNMTHELKTPVSSIKLAWEMLTDTSIDHSPEMKKRLYNIIDAETRRLSLIIEKVLQFSLVEGRKIKLHPERIDTSELLQEISGIYSLRVKEYGGSVKLNLDATNTWIYVDRMSFQNIIFNLMDNAIKYKKADVPPQLTLSTHNKDNKLCICIEDNGIGITKEDRSHIFEQFFRVNTGQLHNVKGFGLGLAYVQGMIKVMKGTVKVDSKLGVGTKMTIEIPNIDANKN